MRALSLDLGAQLLFHLRITELAARVDDCSHCGIAPQLYCKRQILDLPRPRHEALGPESFRVGHEYDRQTVMENIVVSNFLEAPGRLHRNSRSILIGIRQIPANFEAWIAPLTRLGQLKIAFAAARGDRGRRLTAAKPQTRRVCPHRGTSPPSPFARITICVAHAGAGRTRTGRSATECWRTSAAASAGPNPGGGVLRSSKHQCRIRRR